MNGVKRLTPPQSRKVNALVRRTCCNYDNGNCILLDDGDECVCPQLISYSLLCKVVPGCGASRRQATLCGALPDRGQEEVYRVRRVLCVNL